jgi:hypothetical protein
MSDETTRTEAAFLPSGVRENRPEPTWIVDPRSINGASPDEKLTVAMIDDESVYLHVGARRIPVWISDLNAAVEAARAEVLR